MANIKDLSHPVWDEVRDGWISNIPLNLVPPTANAEQLIQLSGTDLKNKDKSEVDLVTGLAERTFGDILFLRDKANYCFRASKTLAGAGHPTITALSMYDACYFSAKALVYLLGFRDVGGSSKAYLHIFHYEIKKRQRLLGGHYCLFLEKRLEHEILWNIFERLLNTLKGEGEGIDILKIFIKNNFSSFSKERNRIIYQCQSWSRGGSYDDSDLINDVSYIDNWRYFSDSGSADAEYVDKYYRTTQVVLNAIDLLLGEIGTFAPVVRDYLQAHPGPSRAMRFDFA